MDNEIVERLKQKIENLEACVKDWHKEIDASNKAEVPVHDWILIGRDTYQAQLDLLLSILDGRPQFEEDDIPHLSVDD